jgi:acetate kinase
MPRVAQAYALPPDVVGDDVIRYGFHGLSYEYVLGELRAIDSRAAEGRVVIAHLGNGASMAAVRDGKGIDTTMGFTPTGGLVMGTRPGDLDPGVILYLEQTLGMQPAEVNDLVSKRSGLLGVSGTTSDMAALLEQRDSDVRARLAVALFCYVAKKHLGALVAALGGLDTLIFTGGIGEHAAPVRAEICNGLDFLGLHLAAQENQRNAGIISQGGSPVTVRVMETDEDEMIARHTRRVLSDGG